MRAAGRLRGNLDGAGPRHRRGRDHIGATLRVVTSAEVIKENSSLTHDCDNCGYDYGYQVAAPVFCLSVHLPVQPIRCFALVRVEHATSVTVDRRCAWA
jgi:hypothetical protein